MKTKIYFLFTLMLITVFACGKDEEETPKITIEIPEPDPDDTDSTPEFVEGINPNLNDGPITFEEDGPSFNEEDSQPEDRSTGNWSRFGGVGESNITVEYGENPESNDLNSSVRVIKVSEPVDVQSWAGFYFMLEEKINFPSGKEAISFQFYSPGPDHNVLLKLEDELPNGTDGKKSTGDLFAVTTGTGWETLVFNIPELEGRDGVYNTITMILGYGLTNESTVTYYVDNFDFAIPVEVIAAAAPQDAPEAPLYSADEVISIFSDAYTSVEGLNLNPDWGQSTIVTEETISENTVLKYENLNYQGTTLETPIDLSRKTKMNLDYFSGDATVLKIFLISPDGDDEDDLAEETSFELDLTNTGQWNRAIVDLSHFAEVVDLSQVFQLKVEGNGTVYLDNLFFYGGEETSGDKSSNSYEGAFGGATVVNGTFNFPSSVESWAGFADLTPSVLSFPFGGKITFNGSTAGTDVTIKFKFERLGFNAEGNEAADTEPSFFTEEITVSGTDSTEYSLNIAAQDADNTYASHLLYLVTQDAEVNLSDIVITTYHQAQSE